MTEFNDVLERICQILSELPNQKGNLEACKHYCCLLRVSGSSKVSLLSAQEKSEINNCKNFKQLFDIVNRYISWGEYSVLRNIIDECKSVEAIREFYQYKRKKALAKDLEIISSIESDPPPGFEKFYVIINQSYKKLTCGQYEDVKTFIFNNLNVRHYVATGYIRVFFDFLHLEWHVTMQAVPDMITVAEEKKKTFKKSPMFSCKLGRKLFLICIHQ